MSGPSRTQYARQADDPSGASSFSQSGQPHTNPYAGGHPESASGSSLPGALQAGRPAPSTANTAPSTIPVLPQITTQQSTPSRGSNASHPHSYSHSSPAAGYTDDSQNSAKYATTPVHKYISQTTQASSYSPLGLDDIRSRADSGLSGGPPGGDPYQDYPTDPTNCSYLAPYPIYAFDWCKWPIHQQGIGESAGKMAIGSYLEDGHNYVRSKRNTHSEQR